MELLNSLHPDDTNSGQPLSYKSREEQLQEEIAERVVYLLDVAMIVVRVSDGDCAEKQGHCQMCGLWDDDHTALCPVPHLEDWLHSRD